jgi:hypothetical protein
MEISKLTSYDNNDYSIYQSYRESVKALNTLDGILKGINIDKIINGMELEELNFWCECHRNLSGRYPYKEIFPKIKQYTSDGILSKDEYDDLVWLCEKMQDRKYDGVIKMAAQELHGVIHGVLADNFITEEEAYGLTEWLNSNQILQGIYPYDEIYALLSVVLVDKKLDKAEADMLKAFFSDFVDIRESWNLNKAEIDKLKSQISLPGICTICPEIIFDKKTFCFTGESNRIKRADIAIKIELLGGIYHDSVTHNTDYLIIGNNGNPCWIYSCYGRKVEKAMCMRRDGFPILIVHENDFWDAMMDIA